MKNFNIKIILILLISLLLNNISIGNIIENIDTLPPTQVNSIEQIPIFQKPIKYIVVKDNETGKEMIFEEGSKISYYRKDRDKLYHKTIKTITDNGFIVKNQNVQLINIAKIRIIGSNINKASNFVDFEKGAMIQVFTKEPIKKIQEPREKSINKVAKKYIVVKDSETGKEITLKKGSKIVYYRKDRDKKYRKTIESITDDGFIVQNQYVKLSNLTKIKKQNNSKVFFTKALPALVLFLGGFLMIFSGIQLFSVLGTFIVGLVLAPIVGIFVAGLILLAIGGLMTKSASRKRFNFFDLKKDATARIVSKK